ncbi:hypothetical protein [Lysinibacillus sp. NPDC047702]|uniref:hypothetical protein n=1 Tax=unclassified Lysinibacillus TaxID=2636778 RepID=UPI003D03403E
MKWLQIMLLMFTIILLTGCGDLLDESDATDVEEAADKEGLIITVNASSEEATENGCNVGEVYIADEDTCVLPLKCDDYDSCKGRGDEIIMMLEEEYGSLTDEESIATDLEGIHTLYTYDIDNVEEMIVTDDDVSDEDIEYHSELWFDFAWLIPESERKDINQFIIFKSGNTLAYVQQHDDSGQYWTLGMNEENIELASETMITYIHEYAHYVSLKDGEHNMWVDPDACEDVYIEGEGCFYEDAYLTDFYEQFWASSSGDSDDNYVSSYAASSVAEDFAESFAHFVLTKQQDELHTIADEKIAFFYEYDYFVELRAHILTRAATWLERAVV